MVFTKKKELNNSMWLEEGLAKLGFEDHIASDPQLSSIQTLWLLYLQGTVDRDTLPRFFGLVIYNKEEVRLADLYTKRAKILEKFDVQQSPTKKEPSS
jgi:hypothetical protein